jgi:two-component system response regulator FixJ
MSLRVLLVEDDELVRRSTERLLQRAGHRVDSFASGDELLEQGVPDDAQVILLDMRLPGRSGLEVLRELGRNGNSVPVVIMTAHGDVPMAVGAMKLGAADFLQKPYPLKKLTDTIGRVIHVSRGKGFTDAERADARSRIDHLTERQRHVLYGLAAGEPNKAIANRLGISVRTVETYRAQLLDRLGIRSAAEAIRLATIAGVPPPISRRDVRH